MSKKKNSRLIKLFLLGTLLLILAVLGGGAALLNNEVGGKKAAPPPSIIITPFVTVSQCTPCHGGNLDAFKNPILIFRHDVHLDRGIRCAACHTEFAHAVGKTFKPSMTVCYNCHNQSHSGQGMVASGACNLCHPPGFRQVPASHTPQFRAGGHKTDAAADNSFSCTTCHPDESFCVRCHTARKAKPADHGKKAAEVKKWKKEHGLARDDGNCSICHDDKFCTTCHITPMPHPTEWQKDHRLTARVNKRDCRVCHESREECSECHHQFKGTTVLTAKSCTSCHEDYKESLTTLITRPVGIRDKGIIIHRAHFEMTRTDPFTCDECHDRKYVTAKGCFGFELCYTCHGRMRGGSLIAKWGGQELCYRCHPRK